MRGVTYGTGPYAVLKPIKPKPIADTKGPLRPSGLEGSAFGGDILFAKSGLKGVKVDNEFAQPVRCLVKEESARSKLEDPLIELPMCFYIHPRKSARKSLLGCGVGGRGLKCELCRSLTTSDLKKSRRKLTSIAMFTSTSILSPVVSLPLRSTQLTVFESMVVIQDLVRNVPKKSSRNCF